MQPRSPNALARMDQIISIIDSYGYWPLVRQVFAHEVLRPLDGREFDRREVDAGLAASQKVLLALEDLLTDDPILTDAELSLTDLHLDAMVAYFALAPAGLALLKQQPKLASWSGGVEKMPSLAATILDCPLEMHSPSL